MLFIPRCSQTLHSVRATARQCAVPSFRQNHRQRWSLAAPNAGQPVILKYIIATACLRGEVVIAEDVPGGATELEWGQAFPIRWLSIFTPNQSKLPTCPPYSRSGKGRVNPLIPLETLQKWIGAGNYAGPSVLIGMTLNLISRQGPSGKYVDKWLSKSFKLSKINDGNIWLFLALVQGMCPELPDGKPCLGSYLLGRMGLHTYSNPFFNGFQGNP